MFFFFFGRRKDIWLTLWKENIKVSIHCSVLLYIFIFGFFVEVFHSLIHSMTTAHKWTMKYSILCYTKSELWRIICYFWYFDFEERLKEQLSTNCIFIFSWKLSQNHISIKIPRKCFYSKWQWLCQAAYSLLYNRLSVE